MCLVGLYNSTYSMFSAGGVVVSNPDPLEKVAKIGYKTIDLVSSFINLSEPFKLLAGHLKSGVAFFETVQFVGKLPELVCPNPNGDYFFSIHPWSKCVEKASMAAHSVLKCFRTLSAQGIVKLGKLGAMLAGRLTVFSLVTDALFITSCSFTIWDSFKQGCKASQDLSTADMKIKKWEGRKVLFSQMQVGKQESVDYKLKKWRVMESNATLDRNKTLIAAVHCLGMIFVVGAGVAISATNCVAAFAIRSWLTAGIATDSLGISRFLYSYYSKPELVPVR